MAATIRIASGERGAAIRAQYHHPAHDDWEGAVSAQTLKERPARSEAEARQVSSGLVVAQVLSAFPGAIIGIPLGLGLFKVAVSDGSLPSPLWLITTVIGTLVVMAALTVIPARIGSMQSIVGALQAEAT